jgi:hypothetical protein
MKNPTGEKISFGETPFETVSRRISPKWGKHSQIENAYGIFFSLWEK